MNSVLEKKAVSFSDRQILRLVWPLIVESFLALWEPMLQQGQDIVYVGFSSALSGTVNSAQIAGDDRSSSSLRVRRKNSVKIICFC